MNSDNHSEPISSVDSDLMRFFDDELDENEIAELEAALASDEASLLEAEAKLDGLDLVRGLLIEAVDEDTRADGIADDVMAKLDDREELAPADAAPKLPLQKSKRGVPANDNSRTLWTLAAAAAAVAAGMFIWGNADVDVDQIATAPAPLEAPAQTVEPAKETLGDAVGAAPPPQVAGNASDEDEDAVEIAQLDFGAHSGSIFKVDNDSTGVHTAVVWVNDSGDDE